MADFKKAFDLIMKNEGGYVNDPDDSGGETYKGIARNRNASWRGWVNVDLLKQKSGFPENLNNDTELQSAVMELYQINYWHKVQGEGVENQDIANSIFDFAVNAGVKVSSRLAQIVCRVKSDGVIGKNTLSELNTVNAELFISKFALTKIARYTDICRRIPKNRKYFYGWINRTLEGLQ